MKQTIEIEVPDGKKAVWKDKFDPKTLKSFDRILQRDNISDKWHCGLFSFFNDPMLTHNLQFIVPYNEETKHLVGTSDEAPEYYRYWEE